MENCTCTVKATVDDKPLADSAVCSHRVQRFNLLLSSEAQFLLVPPELPHWPKVSFGTFTAYQKKQNSNLGK